MRKLNVRFENEKDFEDWKARHDLDLSKDSKELNLATGETTLRKKTNRKQKPGVYEERMQYWKEMPHYSSTNVKPFAYIIMYFEDVKQVEDLIEQEIKDSTKSVYVPKRPTHRPFTYKRVLGGNEGPKYPIYVVSKNRPNNATTSFHLSLMQVPHYIVVEPDQMEMYKKSTLLDFNYAHLLEMDMSYYDNYDTFDDLGDTKGKGPGAARNFAWEHSMKMGYDYHWVFDDNATGGFYMFDENERLKVRTGEIFRVMEEFVERFDNIGQAGLNYRMFISQDGKYAPFATNTRIYSFLFIRNDIPYRWRGRYNEDTDLSLRMLKDGWVTVQFNEFLAEKAKTQTVKGGNTEEFYAKEGTKAKSQMLVDMHPDVARLQYRFGRDHHYVDYSGFTQQLHYRKGVEDKLEDKFDNHGMKIVMTQEETGNRSNEKYRDELEKLYNKEN